MRADADFSMMMVFAGARQVDGLPRERTTVGRRSQIIYGRRAFCRAVASMRDAFLAPPPSRSITFLYMELRASRTRGARRQVPSFRFYEGRAARDATAGWSRQMTYQQRGPSFSTAIPGRNLRPMARPPIFIFCRYDFVRTDAR